MLKELFEDVISERVRVRQQRNNGENLRILSAGDSEL